MRSVVEIGASVPAFLGKLWKLVNDTETNHLISWSPGGKTFVIKNQADFARELLPLYYKHNNMASFIRQLNMYGFHKITSVENGGLRYEKDEIEFSHPCFMKGHAYLLEHIKRKIANPKSLVASNENGEKVLMKPELMNKVLSDVKQMKGKQESLDAKFSAMKQENEALWREVAILRQKHIKQQQIVNNLIQFLMSLVQPPRTSPQTKNACGVKRPYQLMINNAAHNSATDASYPGKLKNLKLDKESIMDELSEDNPEDGPTIHELAHDDMLHNDGTQDSLNESDFISVDMPNMSNTMNTHSPTDPSTSIYHVTMEDGDDTDAGVTRLVYPVTPTNGMQRANDTMPIITSASPSPVTPVMNQPMAVEPPVNNVMGSPRVVVKIEGQMPPKSKGRNQSVNKGATTSTGKCLLTGNYNSLNPSADLKLPAEIFASDDSVSDAGVTAADDISMQNALQDLVDESLLPESKDKMLGGINIKIEGTGETSKSNKKSKKSTKSNENTLNLADIKTELQDDFDWNNMTLATVNNNTNKFQSRNDIDDHLDAMQTDLESLRELLRSDSYTFDTNTLLGTPDARVLPSMSLAIPSCQPTTNNYLFGSDDPFYGLPYNSMDDRAKPTNNAKKQKGEISNVSSDDTRVPHLFTEDNVEGNQLISYTGNIPDFEDINMPDLECDNSQDPCVSPTPSSSTLNTPQMQVRSPSFSLKP
ncbi:heat shock factor protein isoform X2 [Spodoptera litura]|uniref:Heat shock factor protein isoform X2 n=1 Tax=Spodoptera litura TaxID=69820 RepID=A0A9J7IT10_SPOLT|nr:heat shock factor protein isoform X2 [Spodoptera litura]